MACLDCEHALRKIPELQEQGYRLSRGLRNEVLKGGEPTRKAADVLHGRWLGHPLHAALTDATVGAWLLGAVLDCIGLALGHKGVERCAAPPSAATKPY